MAGACYDKSIDGFYTKSENSDCKYMWLCDKIHQ